MNPVRVREALVNQDAAIIAPAIGQGEEFVRIVDNMISQCELEPSFSGRVWVMGGAGLLDIPYTDLIGNHLPGFPPEYRNHNRNFERSTDRARLVHDVSGNHDGFERATRAGSSTCNNGYLARSDA